MRREKPGFTLIELLMVILVIGLLIVMLMPAVSAVKKAVRTYYTQSMIWEIDAAIGKYKDTFGDYPPSGKPADADWSGYPDGWVPDDPSATAAGTGYGPFVVKKDYPTPPYPGVPTGGQYLTYFLFGPARFGWNTREHAVSINWTPPSGLDRYLTKKPLRNIGHQSHYYYGTPPYWYFEDAFGLTGNRFAGAILYMRADTRKRTPIVGSESSNARWIYKHVQSVYQTACRGGSWGYTGDNKPRKNLARLLEQCPKGFALMSAGADQHFGYRAKNTQANNKDREGADWDDGASDDITNFVHD